MCFIFKKQSLSFITLERFVKDNLYLTSSTGKEDLIPEHCNKVNQGYCNGGERVNTGKEQVGVVKHGEERVGRYQRTRGLGHLWLLIGIAEIRFPPPTGPGAQRFHPSQVLHFKAWL